MSSDKVVELTETEGVDKWILKVLEPESLLARRKAAALTKEIWGMDCDGVNGVDGVCSTVRSCGGARADLANDVESGND